MTLQVTHFFLEESRWLTCPSLAHLTSAQNFLGVASHHALFQYSSPFLLPWGKTSEHLQQPSNFWLSI